MGQTYIPQFYMSDCVERFCSVLNRAMRQYSQMQSVCHEYPVLRTIGHIHTIQWAFRLCRAQSSRKRRRPFNNSVL